MELVSTMEINGEEREIADAYARWQIATNAQNIATNAEGIAELNNNLSQLEIDLKMLGYTVPKEMPVQNYVDSDGVFHQRVGRVDLKDALFEYNNTYSSWSSIYMKNIAKYSTTDQSINTNFYSNMYSVYTGSLSNIPTDSLIMGTSGTLWINNSSSTEKPSGYLYFELAEENLIKVDGNEAVTKVNDSLSVIGKCKNLLKPTLQTTTQNGITCTNNGDGTYTLNGTATADVELYVCNFVIKNASYRVTGCPKNGSVDTYYLRLTGFGNEIGNGMNSGFYSGQFNAYVIINIRSGYTCNNLVFKPMLTTNLNATYDDFVPYTGDGETLTADVAELKNDLGGLSFSVSGTTLSITDGTNTWTLSQ